MTVEWDKVLMRLKPHCEGSLTTVEDCLVHLYLECNFSLNYITDLTKGECSAGTITNILKKLKVKRRKRGGPHNVRLSVEIPEEEYKTMTYKQLAKKYKVDRTTIYRHVKQYNKKSEHRISD